MSSHHKLEVSGYNEKLPLFLQTIFDRLLSLEVKEERFAVVREQKTRDFDNFKQEQPYMTALSNLRSSMFTSFWSSEQKLKAIQDITCQHLRDFIPQFMSRLKIQSLVQGNVSQEEAKDLFNGVVAKLNPFALFPQEIPERRLVHLDKGVTYSHLTKNFNEEDQNSAVWSMYQVSHGRFLIYRLDVVNFGMMPCWIYFTNAFNNRFTNSFALKSNLVT